MHQRMTAATMERGTVRLQCDCAIVAVQRLCEESEVGQLQRQVVVGLRLIGCESDEVTPSVGCFRQPVGSLESDSENDPGGKEPPLHRDGGPTMRNGGFEPTQCGEESGEGGGG